MPARETGEGERPNRQTVPQPKRVTFWRSARVPFKTVKVLKLLEKRVSASHAEEHYEDLTPAEAYARAAEENQKFRIGAFVVGSSSKNKEGISRVSSW